MKITNLNTKSTLLALLLSFQIFFSQNRTIDNVGIPDFNDVGTVYKDSTIFHYVFHTKILNNNETQGFLNFYNENLSEIKQEAFSLNKNYIFMEAKNNGNNVIAGFHDFKKEINRYNIYSNEGKLLYSKELSFKKNAFSPYVYKIIEKSGEYAMIFPIKDKGFLISEIEKKKRFGYNLHFLGNDENLNWTYESPKEHNNRKSAVPLFANDKVVVILEKEWGSVYDRQPTFIPIILDAHTGKEQFRLSHQYEKIPNFYTKAFATENGEIILFGEKYKLGNNFPDNDYNTGYFIEKYSSKGELLASNSFDFEDPNFKKTLKFNPQDTQKEYGTVFFQNILEINGKLYLLGEKTRRDKQGFTVAKAIVTGSLLGVHNIAGQNWNTEYTMGDWVMLELDESLKLSNTHHIPKEKNKTGLNTMIVRPYFNLLELNYNQNLNYVSFSKSQDNLFNIVFLDRKVVNKKPEIILSNGRYQNGNNISKISSKIELGANEFYFKVIPRDSKSSLLVKYDAEKKMITLDIVK